MQGLGEALGDVASLVNLAALDRGVAAEGLADRLGQRLGSIDDEEAADRRVEASADQVIQEGLHHGGILGCPFDHAQRVFVAGTVDANRAHQQQFVIHVHSVDLDDQQIQFGQIGCHPFRHALRRQRHEPARYRRFGHARTLGRRNITCR